MALRFKPFQVLPAGRQQPDLVLWRKALEDFLRQAVDSKKFEIASKAINTYAGGHDATIPSVDRWQRLSEPFTVNVELIRARLKEGFRPFALVMSSGNKYPVHHPEFIFLTQRTVIVADRRGYTINLDPLHVVGIEDIPAARNGRSKRRSNR
jgi:hypothetical protein